MMTKKEKREYMKKWRAEHQPQIKANRRRYYLEHKAKGIAETKRWGKENPDKIREYEAKRPKKKLYARRKVQDLVHKGKLKKLPCEVCGAEPTQAHHKDYDKPLDIVWLCQKCHAEEHRKMKHEDEK